jgi:hypothetical protein
LKNSLKNILQCLEKCKIKRIKKLETTAKFNPTTAIHLNPPQTTIKKKPTNPPSSIHTLLLTPLILFLFLFHRPIHTCALLRQILHRVRERSHRLLSSPSPPSDLSHAPLGPTAIQSHDLNIIPDEISTAILIVKSPFPPSVMSSAVTESDDRTDLNNHLVGSGSGAVEKGS